MFDYDKQEKSMININDQILADKVRLMSFLVEELRSIVDHRHDRFLKSHYHRMKLISIHHHQFHLNLLHKIEINTFEKETKKLTIRIEVPLV